MAQRVACDVDHALGLNRDRAREDLLRDADRQFDGVLLGLGGELGAKLVDRAGGGGQGGERGLGSLLGRGDSGCAPLGLAGGASLVADPVGLGADGRQHVGDLLRAPRGRGVELLERVAGHGRRGRLLARIRRQHLLRRARGRRRRLPRACARLPRSVPGPLRPRAFAAAAGIPFPRSASGRRARTCCRGCGP